MQSKVKQVGGDHYQAAYQHWDLVIDTEVHHLIACATKYVTRFHKKEGVKDLKKAISYLQKYHLGVIEGRIKVSPPTGSDLAFLDHFLSQDGVFGSSPEFSKLEPEVRKLFSGMMRLHLAEFEPEGVPWILTPFRNLTISKYRDIVLKTTLDQIGLIGELIVAIHAKEDREASGWGAFPKTDSGEATPAYVNQG